MFVCCAVSIVRGFELLQLLSEPGPFSHSNAEESRLERTLETRLYLALKVGDFGLGRAVMSS